MKLEIYALYDPKLERFQMPFFVRNEQEAKVLILRSGIPKSIYDDIRLYRLGVFSDDDINKPMLSYVELDQIKLLPYPEVNNG